MRGAGAASGMRMPSPRRRPSPGRARLVLGEGTIPYLRPVSASHREQRVEDREGRTISPTKDERRADGMAMGVAMIDESRRVDRGEIGVLDLGGAGTRTSDTEGFVEGS